MTHEEHGFKVRNLANNNLSHASKDAYLICQRLDRIIALLEEQAQERAEKEMAVRLMRELV